MDGWNNCSLPLLSQPQPRQLSKKGAENQLRSKHCISGCYNASARLSVGRSKKGRLAMLEMRNKGRAGVPARKCISFFHKTFLEFFPTLHWHILLLRILHKRPSTYKTISKLPDDSSETAGTFTLFNSKQPPSLQGKHVLGLALSNSPH